MCALVKFIKEHIADRVIAKFQDNVQKKFDELDQKICELEARIEVLEGP